MKRVQNPVQYSNIIGGKAEDIDKNIFYRRIFICAYDATSIKLEQILEEFKLLIFGGPKYEFTYNVEGKFSQQQISLLYDLNLHKILYDKIIILVRNFRIKEFDFDAYATKEYFQKVF